MDALIERGHSIVIIEHNLEVVKCTDYVIDLGPDSRSIRKYTIALRSTPRLIS